MARKELTKNARQIADLIYKKSANRTNRELARLVGLSESQYGRTFSPSVEMVSALIDELEIVLIDKDEMKALRVLARKGLDK
ncbi:CII family transcriptional regulator [Phocoenobacter skyensis]|uniref:CII family transcriptional regulator n=1 Tax=Phocoenobacter skyensis TaxID=97481 RepID=A0ABT9JIB3_9PAST|nr:CII family transcriptional regulator [Pasteurella skyensis]MDP8078357.1 CII family transcriptional regulator [Pasteurella skyensis]MDP8084551.1 CII family transcriptional regulator [Pasteurella skyensis]